MNNYDDKIEMIKENQKKLLILARNNISENGIKFNSFTKSIVDVLNYDTKVVKKYEAVLEAQSLIQKYTDEIKNSKSIEEIVEIRKELNKCINKIKKEMKNRGIDDYEFNQYTEESTKLRKSIAQKIRFIKRDEKINEIEELSNNYDNLDKEGLERLKKLVKNELAYSKRNLGNNIIFNLDEKKEEKLSFDEMIKEFSSTFNRESKPIEKMNELVLPELPVTKAASDFKTYDSLEDYLGEKVDFFRSQYCIENTEEYNGGVIKNITVFTKNLPKLISNKKRSKHMIRDYEVFCRRPELLGYSNYVEKNNSIVNNFKKAMKKSVLKEKEGQYQDEHGKCVEWIIKFCNINGKEIKYNKTMNA